MLERLADFVALHYRATALRLLGGLKAMAQVGRINDARSRTPSTFSRSGDCRRRLAGEKRYYKVSPKTMTSNADLCEIGAHQPQANERVGHRRRSGCVACGRSPRHLGRHRVVSHYIHSIRVFLRKLA